MQKINSDNRLVHIIFMAGLLFCFMQNCAMELQEQNQDSRQTELSVSYIYYPSGYIALVGHAEIEIDRNSWNMHMYKSSKPLQDMIEKSTADGMPFLRFVFYVKPDQMEIIKKSIADSEVSRVSCSMGALTPLHEAGICNVPLPIRVSPLTSAAYLASSKKMGLNNVAKIEYYGNPSLKKSIAKMLVGASTEAWMIYCWLFKIPSDFLHIHHRARL